MENQDNQNNQPPKELKQETEISKTPQSNTLKQNLQKKSEKRLNLNRQLKERQISQKSSSADFARTSRKARQRSRRGSFGQTSEYEEKLIKLARVVKVVKGGRRFSFSAYVVVGNRKGKIGLGHGNANEVQDAIRKAARDGVKNLIEVPIVKTSVPHEVFSKFLATKVLLKPASIGRGLVAGGVARTIVELAGYVNITTKVYGSRNPQNVALATLKALQAMKTKRQLLELRFGPKQINKTQIETQMSISN